MQKLIEGLHKFRAEVFDAEQPLFAHLSKGQHPEALFITCSDSRINPNMLTQTKPGDLFILRNAGNIVPPYERGGGEAATIEFAIEALAVKHIIVCGHTLCGAMKGLLNPSLVEKTPAVQAWLTHADATRRIIQENYAHLEGEALLKATVEENVLSQVENLRTHPSVRARLRRGEIMLHAWVYKIETGDVFRYDTNQEQFTRITEIEPSSDVTGEHAYREAI